MLDLLRRPQPRPARRQRIAAAATRAHRRSSRPWLARLTLAAAGALMLAVGAGSAAAAPARPTSSGLSAVNQNVSVTPHDFWPRVAVDPAGDAVAVWLSDTGNGTVVQASTRPAGGVWQPPADLSAGGDFNNFPQVTIDPAGDAVAVWAVSFGGNHVVQAAARPAGGAWQAPGDLSTFGDEANEPQVAIDQAGDAVAVWQDNPGGPGNIVVQAATRPAGGVWQAPIDLSAPSEIAESPQVALNGAGDAVAVWDRFNGINGIVQTAARSARALTRFWQAPVDLSAPVHDAGGAHVAIDQAGDAVAVWAEFATNDDVLRAASRPAGRAWQPPTDLSAPASRFGGAPQVAMNPAGLAYAVWPNANNVPQATARPAGSAWQPPVDLSAPNQCCIAEVRVALDPAGDAVAVWDRYNGVNRIVQAAARSAQAVTRFWQAPVDLSTPTGSFPDVALDRAGSAVAVWEHFDDIGSIVQTSSRPTTSGVWQTPVNLSTVPITVLVPDVVGSSKRFAGPTITAAGLVPRFTGATTATNSYVASETPTPGTRVLRGSTITLYLNPGFPP